MVLETSHRGITGQDLTPEQQAAQGQGQAGAPARPPNIYIYDSTRVPENWELMKISHELSQDYGWWKVIRELMDKDVSDKLHRNHENTAKGDTEGTYQCLLYWLNSKRGYGTMGEVCRALKKHNWKDLAESFDS